MYAVTVFNDPSNLDKFILYIRVIWKQKWATLWEKVLELPCFKAYDQGLEQGIEVFIKDKVEEGFTGDVI